MLHQIRRLGFTGARRAKSGTAANPKILWTLHTQMLKELQELHHDQINKKDQLYNDQINKKDQLYNDQINKRDQINKQDIDRLHSRECELVAEVERLKGHVMKVLDQKLKLENNFNVRGALERIAYQAVIGGLVPDKGGCQGKLDLLSQRPDFKTILQSEINNRKLVLKDVEGCRQKLYHEVSKHAHGNHGIIEIPTADYTANELAPLVSFFRLQDTWPDPLKWREV